MPRAIETSVCRLINKSNFYQVWTSSSKFDGRPFGRKVNSRRSSSHGRSQMGAYVLFSGKDGASVHVLFVLVVVAVPGR